MDYNSEEIETGTDAQPMRTDPDFRVSYESEGWDDLEQPSRAEGRLPYYVHQVQKSPDYKGPLDAMSIEEVRALFVEILDYTNATYWAEFPLPCTKLPGFLHEKYDRYEPAGELILIGLRYLEAYVRNERRAMHLRWRQAHDFIAKHEDEVRVQIVREEIARAIAEDERKDAIQQLVYFIGSESGPIKIGMAVRPLERLKTLQTGHHERLELLATCEGGQKAERAYHKRFKAHRLSGEWFKRVPEIESEIERLQSLDT